MWYSLISNMLCHHCSMVIGRILRKMQVVLVREILKCILVKLDCISALLAPSHTMTYLGIMVICLAMLRGRRFRYHQREHLRTPQLVLKMAFWLLRITQRFQILSVSNMQRRSGKGGGSCSARRPVVMMWEIQNQNLASSLMKMECSSV